MAIMVAIIMVAKIMVAIIVAIMVEIMVATMGNNGEKKKQRGYIREEQWWVADCFVQMRKRRWTQWRKVELV